MPQKSSQKYGMEHKIVLGPAFNLYEIHHPCSQPANEDQKLSLQSTLDVI